MPINPSSVPENSGIDQRVVDLIDEDFPSTGSIPSPLTLIARPGPHREMYNLERSLLENADGLTQRKNHGVNAQPSRILAKRALSPEGVTME
jgi:hypothetical protein